MDGPLDSTQCRMEMAAVRKHREEIPAVVDQLVSSCNNVKYHFGQEVTALFETLSEQITLAIRHDCIRHNQDCTHCEDRGQQAAIEFLKELPQLRGLLATDIRAAYAGGPGS